MLQQSMDRPSEQMRVTGGHKVNSSIATSSITSPNDRKTKNGDSVSKKSSHGGSSSMVLREGDRHPDSMRESKEGFWPNSG